MKKAFIRGSILVVLFFSTWYVLTKIDWIDVLNVNETRDKTEEKLGELLWDLIKNSEIVIEDPFVVNSIDSIVNKICSENKIDRELIKVHVLNKDEVNAFALPDGHLIIYSGLISVADNQEELSGVICHEIAHIKLNHVMKKLVKEVGLSVLISMTTGNGGTEIIKETARLLSSTAFDRRMEKEADIKAVDYLIKAKINPEPFANFLYKLAVNEVELLKYLSWVTTHPDSKERAEYIIEYSKDKPAVYESILSTQTWEKLKETIVQ